MILDRLTNADLYRGFHSRIAAALDWLRSTDLARLPLGKADIDGERVFALVQEYIPKAMELGKFEAHRRYWDVQYVSSGEERIGWASLDSMTLFESYCAERDVAFFTGSGSFLRVFAGSFAIFGPHDVHMPGIAPEHQNPAAPVRKVVVKVEG